MPGVKDNEKDKEVVTKEFMEVQVALTRVETLLMVHRDDFLDHTKEDKDTFAELFNVQRAIKDELHEIPKKIVSCRDQLEHKIHDDMKENYVSNEKFNSFTSKITYTLGGIMLVGVFFTWLISNLSNFSRLVGN